MRTFALLALLIAGVGNGAAAHADDDLTLANLNILHGLGCTPDQCRLADRIDLLFEWIDDAGCPDVVTLQEVNDLPSQIRARQLILAELPTACSGQYDGQTAFSGVLGVDEEMVLSRYPIVNSEVRQLHSALGPGFTRHVLWVRIDHPVGPMDVFTTHLASGGDGATDLCSSVMALPCPAECIAIPELTFRECQAIQLVDFVQEKHGLNTPALITGDLNSQPGSFEVTQLTDAGYIDTHLAAGNSECVIATGVGCTSGRASNLSELESTAANVDERIDYAFLVPDSSATCTPALDTPGDGDADGTATQIFADAPNPFASCGASPSPVCWPSDHEGNEVDLNLDGCTFTAVPSLSRPGAGVLMGLVAWVAAIALARRRNVSRRRNAQ